MPSSHEHSYYFYPDSNSPRVMQSLMVEVDPMMDSQRTRPSGSAYPSWSSVTGTYTGLTATGPLDMGDMIYGLASMFWHKRSSTGVWEFTDWAGSVSTTGWRDPITFDKVVKYANGANGETGQIDDLVLNQLAVQIMGEGESSQTQTWFGRRYTPITKPAIPAIPALIDPWIRRNGDWVLELSSSGYGDLDSASATVLDWQFTMPEFHRRIFDLSNTVDGDTGYDTTVRRRVEPTIDLKFLADTEWLDYFSDADDAEYYINMRTHDDEISWTHRCKLVGIPTSFQDDDDAHVITSQFVPVSRPLPSITGDSTQVFTAVASTGNSFVSSAIGATAGYTPDGITDIDYSATDDIVTIEPLSAFGDLIPSSVDFGSTTFNLSVNRTDGRLEAAATTSPFSAGSVTATFTFAWLPNDFIKISIEGSPITRWW